MPQHIITEIEMHVQRTMQTHRDFVWLSETIGRIHQCHYLKAFVGASKRL